MLFHFALTVCGWELGCRPLPRLRMSTDLIQQSKRRAVGKIGRGCYPTHPITSLLYCQAPSGEKVGRSQTFHLTLLWLPDSKRESQRVAKVTFSGFTVLLGVRHYQTRSRSVSLVLVPSGRSWVSMCSFQIL